MHASTTTGFARPPQLDASAGWVPPAERRTHTRVRVRTPTPPHASEQDDHAEGCHMYHDAALGATEVEAPGDSDPEAVRDLDDPGEDAAD